ncbi:MAG: site-specific integrase [Clostridiales bacterium]|nr:site-specific integrase [Clostridiales bacterium]
MTKKRSAQGSGNVRFRSDGRWEARFTYFDDLGQPRRGSVYGATQKECQQKLNAALAKIDRDSFRVTQRYNVKEWVEEWIDTYGDSWKPMTRDDYRAKAERYIYPHLRSVQLAALSPIAVQRWVNKLKNGWAGQKPLSPKSVKNIHGILHSALKQAVAAGLIQANPADNTRLPKIHKPDLQPLMDENVGRFLEAIKGDRFERLFVVDLFTGLRQSELLALCWGDVDFNAGTLTVRRQLQRQRDSTYLILNETKNGKERTVPVPAGVLNVLQAQRRQQAEWKIAAGPAWSNRYDLIFTDEVGHHLKHPTVYKHFKSAVASIGMDSTRFHDMRHSCAIMALQSGANVKSVQEMLGHYSSAFTMDTYAAVSKTMMDDTRTRMEELFDAVSGGEK